MILSHAVLAVNLARKGDLEDNAELVSILDSARNNWEEMEALSRELKCNPESLYHEVSRLAGQIQSKKSAYGRYVADLISVQKRLKTAR